MNYYKHHRDTNKQNNFSVVNTNQHAKKNRGEKPTNTFLAVVVVDIFKMNSHVNGDHVN